jgi:hypothetical protein
MGANAGKSSAPHLFVLDGERFREVLQDEDRGDWIAPLRPGEVSAQELQELVNECLDLDLIDRAGERATLAVYPLAATEEAACILAVDPGLGGPQLCGGELELIIEDGVDDIGATVTAVTDIVDQANQVLVQAAHTYRGLLSCFR